MSGAPLLVGAIPPPAPLRCQRCVLSCVVVMSHHGRHTRGSQAPARRPECPLTIRRWPRAGDELWTSVDLR
eukprot:scaffold7339_cov249-Pinguiococcus_pyrenoidosus.AAC.19